MMPFTVNGIAQIPASQPVLPACSNDSRDAAVHRMGYADGLLRYLCLQLTEDMDLFTILIKMSQERKTVHALRPFW
jgi:hypothetical protein